MSSSDDDAPQLKLPAFPPLPEVESQPASPNIGSPPTSPKIEYQPLSSPASPQIRSPPTSPKIEIGYRPTSPPSFFQNDSAPTSPINPPSPVNLPSPLSDNLQFHTSFQSSGHSFSSIVGSEAESTHSPSKDMLESDLGLKSSPILMMEEDFVSRSSPGRSGVSELSPTKAGGDIKRRKILHSDCESSYGGNFRGVGESLPPEGQGGYNSGDSSAASDFEIDLDSSGEEDSDLANSLCVSDIDSDSSMMSDDSHSDINIPENDLLYDNASVTIDEVVLNLSNVFMKNRLTKTALSDFINFTRSILPEDNLMPRNLNEFLNYIKRASPPVEEKVHVFCPVCFTLKSRSEDPCLTEGCSGKDGDCFYEFPLAEQVRFMFQQRGLADLIDEHNKTWTFEEGFVTNLCDGSEIRKLKDVLTGQYDVALLWNVDGISLKDSDFHLWVCLYTFCQVPPRLRPYLICVNSIYYGKGQPPMQAFLKPFVDSLVEIHEAGGVQWTHPDTKQKFVSKVAAPGASSDAPARADLQDIKRYNSKNGCNVCEITCEPVKVLLKTTEEKVRETTRYYYVFQENDAKLRSGRRMLKQAAQAKTAKDKSVLGVKGVSPAEPIPYLDVGKFVFPEYMHSVLLGNVLSFTLLMIHFKGSWSLQRHIKEINERLSSLEIPDFLKMPGRLSHVGKYHAHELRAWLLYFSVPILCSYLPSQYFQHWILLVGSIYLLLKERISENDLKAADGMLRMFVRDVGALYGKTAYKYNTHQLLHQVLLVRRFGPLSENSTFMFESFNGILTRMIHGTKHKGRELVENIKIATGVMALKYSIARNSSSEVSNYVLSNPVDFSFSRSDVVEMAQIGCSSFNTFQRVKVGKEVYTSKMYDSKVRRCNSFISVDINDNSEVAQILCFVQNSVSNEVWCCLDIYPVEHTRLFMHRATRYILSHIIPIGETPTGRAFVPLAKVKDKLIKVENYVCVRPNSIEVNL